MYFEIIKAAIAVVLWGCLLAIALYVGILLILRVFNKYNVRNAWFILLSFFVIPFLMLELSVVLAAQKIKTSVVLEAKEYACSIMSGVDNYKTYVGNVVGDKVSETKDAVAVELSSGINQIDAGSASFAKEGVTAAAGMVLNQAEEAVGGYIEQGMDYLPDNPVATVLEKFPVLKAFLKDNDIEGENGEQIVDSLFGKLIHGINAFILGCLKWVAIILSFFIGLAVFFGWRKKSRKQKAELKQQQEETISIEV